MVVFKLPRDNSTDYIKRVIGLPGDEIQMRGGVLYINGQAVPRKVRKGDSSSTGGRTGPSRATGDAARTASSTYRARRRAATASSTTPAFQGAGRPLFHDGRQPRQLHRQPRVADRYGVGYVPFENLIGRAEIIFFSAAVDEPDAFRLAESWTWPFEIRWSRFFNLVR